MQSFQLTTDHLQIFYAHSECTEVERAINSDLALVEEWYNLNGLKKTIQNTKPLSGVKAMQCNVGINGKNGIRVSTRQNFVECCLHVN